jgi:hypothetical protein
MERYHLSHHYKNIDLGFGITSKRLFLIHSTVLLNFAGHSQTMGLCVQYSNRVTQWAFQRAIVSGLFLHVVRD